MTDLLMQSAIAYQCLTAYKYHFVMGRKGIQYRVELSFPRESYKHLAGLHKTRIEAFSVPKNALNAVLAGTMSEPIIAVNAAELSVRWTAICKLQYMIESNVAVFRYRNHEFPGSTIRAEYMLFGDNIMCFIDKGCPVSIFTPSDSQLGQMKKCPRLTTLQIKREEISSGSFTTVYQSPLFSDT